MVTIFSGLLGRVESEVSPASAAPASGKWAIKLSGRPRLLTAKDFHHILILWEKLHTKSQTTQTKLQMQRALKINGSNREHQRELFFVWCNGWGQVAEGEKLQPTVPLSWTDLGRRRRRFWGKRTLCLWCPALWEVWLAPLGFWTPVWKPRCLHLSGGSQSRYLLKKNINKSICVQDASAWRLHEYNGWIKCSKDFNNIVYRNYFWDSVSIKNGSYHDRPAAHSWVMKH